MKIARIGAAAAAIALAVSIMVAGTPAGASDGWLGDRHCATGSQCRSNSWTSGTPGAYPYQYTVHKHNGVESTRWNLTAAQTKRSFRAQTGSVSVFLYTTGTLWSQTAACECVTTPCAQ